MSDAERKLWRHLRGNQVHGCKFRRQVPVGRHVADFLCYEAKIIIEVDGGQHSEQKAYDCERTAFLNAHGFEVLRYWNNEVLQNIDGVLADIQSHLKSVNDPLVLPLLLNGSLLLPEEKETLPLLGERSKRNRVSGEGAE